jgi:hypothetical protein
MKTKHDWAAAKAAMLSVAEQYFGEIPRDRKVRCQFHEDRTASLHVYDNGWHCYGCDEGGDAIDLVQRLENCTRAEAYDRIMGSSLSALSALPPPAPKPRDWDYAPGAEGIPTHWVLGTPTTTYPYYREGQLVGLACRWDYTDGRDKDIRPASSVRDKQTGELRWEWVGMGEPRPIYRPDTKHGKLVIVEGEKCADHLRSMGIEACTWAGGASVVDKADWAMVQASRVYIWPDKNTVGIKAADRVAAILAAQGVEVFMVPIDDLPDGHDAANISDKVAIIKRIKSSLPPVSPDKVDQGPEIPPSPSEKKERPLWPFRCLGHYDGWFYFLEHEGQTVVRYSAAGISSATLLEIAPLAWWESNFPKGKGGGIDVAAAADALIRESRKNIYTEESNRGRGIWWDDGRIVYHAGNRAIVDGEELRLTSIESRYAYPIAPALPQPAVPLSDEECCEYILDTARIPSWHDSTHAEIVAGWVMCSLLTGVLAWRPSIWIQGAAGSGKTSIMRDYLGRLLGRFCEPAQGNSSEAGIRQRIRNDARPVIMDEAEPGRGPHELRRWLSIMDLMRQASSDSDAKTLRGTPGGNAQSFHVRAPFCFGSIQCGLSASADRDRVTRISLRSSRSGEIKPQVAREVYADWLAALKQWPHDISERLLARAIALAPIARETARVMIDAMATQVPTKREADQLGTLMAGAWLIQSSFMPTQEQAEGWVVGRGWDTLNDTAQESDADRALGALLGLIIQGDKDKASVMDRIEEIKTLNSDLAKAHQRALGWYGLRYMPQGKLFVATTNEARQAALKDTAYWRDLSGLLSQLAGTEKAVVRVAGQSQRGVIVRLAPEEQ